MQCIKKDIFFIYQKMVCGLRSMYLPNICVFKKQLLRVAYAVFKVYMNKMVCNHANVWLIFAISCGIVYKRKLIQEVSYGIKI